MKFSQISAIATVFSQASLVLGRAVESQASDLDSFNATKYGELNDLFDSIEWLDENDDAAASSLEFGDSIPGQNFLSLCTGDHSNDAVAIDMVNLSPSEPVRGKQLGIQASGTIKKAVTEGSMVSVKVKIGRSGITVYKKKWNLCKEYVKLGGSCPLNPAKLKFEKSFEIPKGLPKNLYSLYVNVLNADGSPVTCLEGMFKLT